MQLDIRAGLLGGVAGAIATIPMTTVMILAQRLGYLGEAPPRLVTDAALEAADMPPEDRATEIAEAGTVHFGIGAALGVLFGLVSSRMPARNRVTQGVIFGLLVWLTAYKGWVPALNIMPPPEKDRKDRPIIMVLAHIVYGATLGWIIKRWGA